MCNFVQLDLTLTFLQAINIVESPRLKKIFLLLREELKESDIPSHATMRTRIEQVYDEYMKQLEGEMAVNQFFKI